MKTLRAAACGGLVGLIIALLLVGLPLSLSNDSSEASDSILFLGVPLVILGLPIGALAGSSTHVGGMTTSMRAFYLLLILAVLSFLAVAVLGLGA
jgi:hypothetical protein